MLIDDELLGLSYLKGLCEEIPTIRIEKAFDDPEKMILEIPNLNFDFCISDIVMPGLTGLQLAEKLKGIPIIFTTAHNEYAADAFDIDAIDYLRKPVQKSRLEKAIEKVIRTIEAKASKATLISVITNKGKMILSSDQLVCISSDTLDRRDKLLTLITNEKLVLKNTSFDQILGQLPENKFCRISKSEVITLTIVKSHSHDRVVTTLLENTGKEIQFMIGENYRKAFYSKMNYFGQ